MSEPKKTATKEEKKTTEDDIRRDRDRQERKQKAREEAMAKDNKSSICILNDHLTPLGKNKLTEEEQDQLEDLTLHWSRLVCKNPPIRRSSHTSFIYDGYMYIVGGVDITEKKQSDMYRINLSVEEPVWEKVELIGRIESPKEEDKKKKGQKQEQKKEPNNEIDKIAYHSGVVYSNNYYIIGGQDEKLQSSNIIQIIDLRKMKIKQPYKPAEDEFPPLESHTANLHGNTAIVFGGHTNKKFNRNVFCINFDPSKDQGEEEEALPEENNKAQEEEVTFPTLDELVKPTSKENKELMLTEYEKIEKAYEAFKVFMGDILDSDLIQKIEEEEKLRKEEEEKHKNDPIPDEEEEPEGDDLDLPPNIVITNLTQDIDFENEGTIAPEPRMEHTSIIIDNNLFIYGGIGPENKYYNDMWKFDLSSNQFTKVDFGFNLEKNPQCAPLARSGHAILEIGGKIYIFGGKIDLIKESNELWTYDPAANVFELIHETLIQQFTPEELETFKYVEKIPEKTKFRLLSKHEVEKRTNPLPFSLKNDKKKKGDKNKDNKKEENNTDKKGKAVADKDKGAHSEIAKRPNVAKMKKSLIYGSDCTELDKALKQLRNEEKAKLQKNMVKIIGDVPEPRDGMTIETIDNKIIVFGGDRNKFPFNDLYVFDVEGVTGIVPEKNPEDEEEKNENEEEQNADVQEGGEEGEPENAEVAAN